MSGPVMAGLTLLIWGVALGIFIAFMKCCGGCRKAKCDARGETRTKSAAAPPPDTPIAHK